MPPVLEIAGGTAWEGDRISFTVTLSQATAQEVTVQYATSSGTAIEGTDFTASNGTLPFSADETTKTIEVSTTDNASFDGDKMFTMTLSGAVNANLFGGATQLARAGDDLGERPGAGSSFVAAHPPRCRGRRFLPSALRLVHDARR